MSEGSINLKELSKRAFSYFGGLSKAEVKQVINYAMIIEGANSNLKASLNQMAPKLNEALNTIQAMKAERQIEKEELDSKCQKIVDLEKHISDLNARLEEKQAKIDELNFECDELATKENPLLPAIRKIQSIVEEFV